MIKREKLTEQEYWKLKYIVEKEKRLSAEKGILESRYKEIVTTEIPNTQNDKNATMQDIGQRVGASGGIADWRFNINAPNDSYIEFDEEKKEDGRDI